MITENSQQVVPCHSLPLPMSGHTILVVDDDRGSTEWLNQCLVQQGYRVLCTGTAEQGMRIARAEHPSLIVLDIALPDGCGLEVCATINDDASLCEIPVIVASGSDDPQVVRRARRAGSKYFLRKPYDPEALLVLIETAISTSRDW